MTVIKVHDHGYPMIFVVSSLHRRSHVVVVDGYLLVSVVIVVVGGGYRLPRTCMHAEFV
jgi:hypothetical protein